MNNHFLLRQAALIFFISVFALNVKAQDTAKKAIIVKTTTANKRSAIPASSKAIPINPKTGKPYSKYGYGAYAKNKYNGTRVTRTADSLNKAAAAKATATAPIGSAPIAIVLAAPVVVDKRLNSQYQYLLTKVYNYQQPFVAALWKNVMDTLNTNRRKLREVGATVAAQTKIITDQQVDIAIKEASLEASDTINLAGVTLSKTTYNLIMWGLVITATAITVLVIARSGSNKNEAAYRTQLYSELEEEFKAYKSKANEKEKKLARELQTERNKVDELMGRG
jgi:hypothetical protein